MNKKESGVSIKSAKPKQTLDEATAEIASLRKELGLKPLEQQPRALGAAQEMLAELRKSKMPTTVAEVKKLASNPSALPSLEAIKRELTGESSSSARITYLNTVVSQYTKAIKAEKDYAKQTELFRSLHRLQKRQAEELVRNKEAWSKVWQAPPEDL